MYTLETCMYSTFCSRRAAVAAAAWAPGFAIGVAPRFAGSRSRSAGGAGWRSNRRGANAGAARALDR